MAQLDHEKLQVMVSAGVDDLQRAELALQTALAAASCQVDVTVFLTQDGGAWGCKARHGEAAAKVHDLVDTLLQLDVAIECCSVCAERLCGGTSLIDEWGGLREGVEAVGLVTFASRAATGTPTITF